MLRKLNPILALAAGLIGGLASRYVTPFAVQAQAPIPAPIPPQPAEPAEIRAQSFTLVDARGNVAGTFRALPARFPNRSNQSDGVVLLDRDGHEIWRAGATVGVRPVTQ